MLLLFDNPTGVGNLISSSSAFSKFSLNIRKFTVHVLLKPGLENFEHYFASMWHECNCTVVWAFFGIVFLWDCPVATGEFSKLAGILSAALSWHHLLGWNSSAISWRIPSPPLDLFVMMLPKVHLTSHSKMFGSRWVITPLCLSRLFRSFLYSSSVYCCHLFLEEKTIENPLCVYWVNLKV